MSTERRRAPRIEILGRLHGYAVAFDVPVRVREISLGGMSVETNIPLTVGALHEFQLTLGDGSTVELSGRVVRCHPESGTGEGGGHLSGIQFVDDDADADEPPAAEGLMDRLA